MVCGVWCVVCGVWCVVCGVWCVVCGVWCVVCGVWCVVCKRRVPVATAVQLREWLGQEAELAREDSGGVAVGSSPVRAARPPASSARPSRHPDWHQSTTFDRHAPRTRPHLQSLRLVPRAGEKGAKALRKNWGSTCLPASETVVDQTLRGSRSRRCHLVSFAEVRRIDSVTSLFRFLA